MSKSIKLKNNNYWDTKGIMHEKKALDEVLNNKVNKNVQNLKLPAGETVDVRIDTINGLVAVRCYKSFMECIKLYGMVGSNGWAYQMTELSALYYTTGGSADISFFSNEGINYIRVKNNASETISVAIGLLNCF